MPDIETVLARIHRRGPCLVELARALRPKGGERYYAWSGGDLGVCVEPGAARFERTGGPMAEGEPPLLDHAELVALGEALRWWSKAREDWWRIGTEHWGNWMSPTIKDVVQPPGGPERVFAIRGHREPSPYLRGAKVAEALQTPTIVASGVVVTAWWRWRADGLPVTVARNDAREVLVPPDGACTGAELALGEGLSCTADPGRFKVCRGADSVTLLPEEDTIVEALLPLLDVP